MAKEKFKIKNLKLKNTFKKFLLFFCGAIIVFLSIGNLAIFVKNEIAKAQKAPIEKEISYWENIVRETPTYRDGFLKLATLYWQLGNNEKVKENLDRASEIDPNYEETKKLKEKLGY